MNPLGYVKEHPYMSGGLIVGAIILFLILRGGGSSGTAATSATGGDIYSAQAAAQTATNQINAQLQGQQATIGGQIQLATIGASRDLSLADLQTQLGLAQINAGQQVTDLANTLTANVAIKNIQGETDKATIAANQSIETTSILADYLKTSAFYNFKSNEANTNAAVTLATSCHGIGCWF